MIKIAPSIVSVPIFSIETVIQELNIAGADMIHFDVEDGCFVPAMNLGVKIIKDLRHLTDLPFDVHLMMVHPEWIIPIMADYGVNRLSVHYEACPYPRRTLKIIDDYGMKAGIAFNPKTSIPDLRFCLPYLSFIILLTTEPEERSCNYLPSVLDKLQENKSKYDGIEWVVDGGVSHENIRNIYSAGANTVVSGRAVFENNAISKNIKLMKEKCSDR
jgi:ribulose-phosphate 3-epimerase